MIICVSLELQPLLERARRASRALRTLSGSRRDAALAAIADAISGRRDSILAANEADMSVANDLPDALRDRLHLDDARIDAIIRSVHEVRGQPDPLEGRREVGRKLLGCARRCPHS